MMSGLRLFCALVCPCFTGQEKVNTSCHYTEKLQLLWGDSRLEFLGTDEASIEERAGMTKSNLIQSLWHTGKLPVMSGMGLACT